METKYMTAGEIKQLRESAEGHEARDLRAGRRAGVTAWAVVDLAMSTGLRVGELARLTCGDVDLPRGALTVTRSKRRVPIRETLAIGKELRDHLRRLLEFKAIIGEPTTPDAPLVFGHAGPLTRRGWQQNWQASVKRAGLPSRLSIHCARHTLAVELLRKTKNLRQVQKQLGHVSPVTTANMYADVTFDDMQAGIDGIFAVGSN